MFNLISRIQIGKYTFNNVISCDINSGFENMTDTAVISLPNVLIEEKELNNIIAKRGIDTIFKRGDQVRIYAGYDKKADELDLIFTGFISALSLKETLNIECEDWMYLLKQINVKSIVLKNTTTKQLIDYCLKGFSFDVNYTDKNSNIGDWVIENTNVINVCQILDELKKYGLYSFFRGEVMNVVLPRLYNALNATTHNIIFENQVIDNNLKWQSDDNANIVIHAISKGWQKTETTKDKDKEIWARKVKGVWQFSTSEIEGETRTYTDIRKTVDELKDIIINSIGDKFIFTGYTGSFTTFLEPNIQALDYVRLLSFKRPELGIDITRKELSKEFGVYRVRSVKKSFGNDGGRQVVELDYPISYI